MNVDRRLPDGSRHEDEIINKSQIYVTTAGWKNTFARPKKFIGEVKLREPQSEGVVLFNTANSESIKYVTLCQAAQAEGSETIEKAKALSRVGLR